MNSPAQPLGAAGSPGPAWAGLRARMEINHRRNAQRDHTAELTVASGGFDYAIERQRWWNPERFSMLWGTPLWDEASPSQRLTLNHLFWVAYYSQIISAEIATIYFNQTSAAGLFGVDEFSGVCRMLDLETTQERSHIEAFRLIASKVEAELFDEPVFLYPMRSPFVETMIFPNSGALRRRWKKVQLQAFGLLSSGSHFLASQYFLIRGLRTLNGKIVQHKLSDFARDCEAEVAPVPASVSHLHYLDESHHFNSSRMISVELARLLPTPTRFERMLVNLGLRGCQRDHASVSIVAPGIFWHEPATFGAVYRVLRSSVFGFDDQDARHWMSRCFGEPSAGLEQALAIHEEARLSYKSFVEPVEWVSAQNHEMSAMAGIDETTYLRRNRRALANFRPGPTS